MSCDLAGHRLLVDGAAVADILIGIRPQKDVVACCSMRTRDSDWYFGGITCTTRSVTSATKIVGRRICPFLAPQRRAERRQIELGVGESLAHGAMTTPHS